MAEATATRLVVVIPGRLPQLANGRRHPMATHRVKAEYRDRLYFQALAQLPRTGWRVQPGQRRKLWVTVRQCRPMLDPDNCVANCKPGIDAAVRVGLLAGDTRALLHLVVEQVAVRHRTEERVEWEVTEAGPISVLDRSFVEQMRQRDARADG